MNVLDHPARTSSGALSRIGFTEPSIARSVALIFIADGHDARSVRDEAEPGDRLMAELADMIDTLTAGGWTPAAALREITRIPGNQP